VNEHITVQVDDDHVARLDGVADQLRAAGMKVEQVLRTIGIITGSVPSERRAGLDSVPGVASIESEHTFQLPSPDSDVQ
jgi:hypothetical protein